MNQLLLVLGIFLCIVRVMDWDSLSLQAQAQEKPQFDVYIESICNDCHRFIANELKYIALHPELLDYVDLNLRIFGKAHIQDASQGIVNCQFGEAGCAGNKAMNCIYKHVSSFTDAINVMECLFEVHRYSEEAIEMCSAKFSVDTKEIMTCYEGKEATELLIEAGYSTPPLRWVPAFRVDGNVRVDTRNLVKEICKHINGEKPEACLTGKHTVGMDAEL